MLQLPLKLPINHSFVKFTNCVDTFKASKNDKRYSAVNWIKYDDNDGQ